jgi:hypothetical protein
MIDKPTGPDLEPGTQNALDALLTLPEPTEPEWSALHASIMAAAGERLARRRMVAAPVRQAPTRIRRRRWLATALPLAAAAAVLIVIGRPRAPALTLDATAEALLADISDVEFSRLVAGHEDAVGLLLLAVQDENEGTP